MYCVYLTVYMGNKMPMFYVGYTRVDKLFVGYHGSVTSKQYREIWENELAEHPSLFKTKLLYIFNTKIEAARKEFYIQSKLKVDKNPLYINKGMIDPTRKNQKKIKKSIIEPHNIIIDEPSVDNQTNEIIAVITTKQDYQRPNAEQFNDFYYRSILQMPSLITT